MRTIITDSYEIQVECVGDEDSPVVYKHQPGQVEHNQLPHIKKSLEFMAELGYYAVSPNPIGIRGSRRLDGDGSINEYTMYNQTNSGLELNKALHNENSRRLFISAGNSGGCRPAVWEAAIQDYVIGYISTFGAATWLRDKNRHERTVEWRNRGFKDILVDPPGGGPPEFVRVPYKYSETAPAYDADEVIKGVFKPKLIIGATLDKIVLKEDVERFFAVAPQPKDIEWIDSNHFYLPEREATIQETAEEKMQEQFKQNGYTDIIPPVRRYSNQDVIQIVNETIACWLDRKKLLPRIGSTALSRR